MKVTITYMGYLKSIKSSQCSVAEASEEEAEAKRITAESAKDEALEAAI
jgi:hypothetical protein